MNPSAAGKRVVVVGGGISGLAAAHRLIELNPALDVTLVEAGPRTGGVIHTIHCDGLVVEQSADNFITSVPWAVDLCRRVGLADALVPTTGEKRAALVVHRGRLVRVPEGFMLMAPARLWPLVTTPLLSPWGKLRLLAEYFVPRRTSNADESLASFARRRLGRQTFERIVQPLVGGIYTADPEKLSLHATLPRFVDMERRYGSLIRGALATRASDAGDAAESGARYGLFVAPREGLSSLVEAITARLPAGCVRLDSPVERIAQAADGTWTVAIARWAERAEPSVMNCDAVIVAVSAPQAAVLLRELDPILGVELARIEYAGTSIVWLVYRRDQIAHPLDGFGFVVPAVEKRRILAGSFASVKFPGRAPEGMVLVRVFIGGACQSELAERADDELRKIATEELRDLLGTSGEPQRSGVVRWPRSTPQYHVGHAALVSAIERRISHWPTLAVAGNAYHGVGIPNCIHTGEVAAERIAAQLAD